VLRHHRHLGHQGRRRPLRGRPARRPQRALNTIDHLTGRGWTPQQAYAICSVAVDLKISQVVDVPNMLVSAFLPEDTFTGS
jgi:acetamidase/formamidase